MKTKDKRVLIEFDGTTRLSSKTQSSYIGPLRLMSPNGSRQISITFKTLRQTDRCIHHRDTECQAIAEHDFPNH
jgi:hypothetical protein